METSSDKSKTLITRTTLVNNKLKFKGEADKNIPVSIDYTAPLGDDSGYTSLELFLLSLSSCVGSSVLTFLRKMRKEIVSCEIRSEGKRKETHPTGFSTIILDLDIVSPDVTDEDLEKVIKLSEDTYCPVWSMIKGNVVVGTNYKITRPEK